MWVDEHNNSYTTTTTTTTTAKEEKNIRQIKEMNSKQIQNDVYHAHLFKLKQ